MQAQQSETRSNRHGRWQWSTLLLPALGVLWALGQAPRPAPRPDVTQAQAERIARQARQLEPSMRRRAVTRFPADPWSQADQFAHAEAASVRRLAESMQVRPGAVLRAIDADVRAHPELPGRPPSERGHVPPCMPRVYYH